MAYFIRRGESHGDPLVWASQTSPRDRGPRNPGDRVYHMGCGVDYNAILAETVERGCSVVAIDARPDLAPRARENLSGYAHVVVDTGDAAEFDPGACDAMLINAGVTHPQPIWLERLREGGRLVMPLTVAVSATIGNGIMLKFVRQYGDSLYAIRSWKCRCAVGAEVTAARRARTERRLLIPHAGHVSKQPCNMRTCTLI